MKKSTALLASLVLLIQTSSFAQKDRFIEISASDTISLKATSIVYTVKSGRSTNPFAIAAASEIPMQDSLMPLASIASLLGQQKFASKPAINTNYQLRPFQNDSALTVSLPDETELKRLVNTLQTIPGISGQVSDAQFESLEQFKEASFRRLYARALADANAIAAVSGGSVGKLISVQESPGNAMSEMMTGYSNAIRKNEIFSAFFGGDNPLEQTVYRKLVFRFELK